MELRFRHRQDFQVALPLNAYAHLDAVVNFCFTGCHVDFEAELTYATAEVRRFPVRERLYIEGHGR